MKNLLYERGFFLPALFLSVSIHGLLIGASGWLTSMPSTSVIQAPSSLEVTVIRQPVVSLLEEEMISEEIMEGGLLDELVYSSRSRESDLTENHESTVANQESRGAVTKAEPLTYLNPAPPYPKIARQRGWEGLVRLEVFLDQEGIPRQVDVRKSSGYEVLDKAALQTVEKWKFSPARSGSMRFPSKITIPIRFTLVQEQ